MPAARHARPSRTPVRLAVLSAVSGTVLPLLSTSASAGERETSTVRLSGPGRSVDAGPARLSVRLLSDGRWVRNGVVDLQIAEGSGWRTVQRVPTDARGLGYGTVRVSRDTRVRAYYRGSSVRTPDASPSTVIDVDGRTSGAVSPGVGGVLAEAARHRGKPYRYGATGPGAFDCSGFTQYVYRAVGKRLPHSSRAQEDVTRKVARSQAQPGDLVFIQDVPGHVGIYAGGGKMWDAPRTGKTVQLRSIWTSDYTVGRVV